MTLLERVSGLERGAQAPVMLVGLGHGATHWVAAIFYLLLPYATLQLGLTYVEAGGLAVAFQVASFVANLGSGPLVDVTGRRVLLQVTALVVGAAALAGFAVAGSYAGLLGLAALIGASNNLWHPAAISYLSARHPKQRGYALSIHALGANAGDAVAPLVAGAAIGWLGWHLAAAGGALPALAVAAVLALALPRAGGGTAGGARGLGGRAYLDGLLATARNRAVLSLCLMAGFRTMAQTGLLVFLPLYLAHDLELAPGWVGLGVALLQVGGVIAAPVAGTLSDRIGRRPIVQSCLSVSTLLILALALAGSGIVFAVGISLLGFALYAIRPVVHSWMMDLTPPELGGSATGLMFGTQAALAALMPLLGGIMADRWGLGSVFYLLAGTMLVANLLVLLLPHERPRGEAP